MQDSANKSTRNRIYFKCIFPYRNYREFVTGLERHYKGNWHQERSRPLRILLVLAVILTSIALPAAAQVAPTREPTNVERAYIGFALDQKNPDICAKISPFAIDVDRFFLPGRQVFYTRSSCYMQLALMTLKPEYCAVVQPAKNTFFATGWYYTRENCEKFAKSEKPVMIAYAINYPIVMKTLGYTEFERKGRDWGKFYTDIRENQDKSLQRRINKMPDFSKAIIEDFTMP